MASRSSSCSSSSPSSRFWQLFCSPSLPKSGRKPVRSPVFPTVSRSVPHEVDKDLTITTKHVYWPQLLAPYLKNIQVFHCPDGITTDAAALAANSLSPNTTGEQLDAARATYAEFGWNYFYLSHDGFSSTTLSEINSTAATILFADSNGSYTSYTTNALGIFFIVPPVGVGSAQWKMTGANKVYGRVAPRHTGQANTAFVDGHSKSLSPDKMIQGCDIASQTITDKQAYLWDLE